MSLPVINGANPNKVSQFYEKLCSNVQALETMGKLGEVNGYVRMTLNKLEGIRGDLVRTDDDWQEWKFDQLVEALRKWTVRNPPKPDEDFNQEKPPLWKPPFKPPPRFPKPRDRVFNSRQEEWKTRPCVYCESSEHRSVDCNKIVNVAQRKKYLSEKRLCFNCTGTRHRAADCRVVRSCQKCNGRHHTSICDRDSQQMLLATGEGAVIYPVVVVDVHGIKCRALLDTGAGSSYASAALIERLGKQPSRMERKRIDMMMCSTNQKIYQYDVKISSIVGDFNMAASVSKVDRSVLLTIPNPRYADKIHQYSHLQGVVMNDEDKKPELPIHLILGASEYSRIKTDTKPRIGKAGEPVAELTSLGWTMMSAGKEAHMGSVYLTRTSSTDYEQLCSLDVLGLQDRPDGDQQSVYEDFKEQLRRSDEGWYETGLLWKHGHDLLPNNDQGSLRRLESLLKKLQKEPNILAQYDEVIQDQLAKGIVERVSSDPVGREFYIPHKPVVREAAESTKLRIVFDASARSNERSPSLNDCLETGPPLQNLLWDILVRNRFKPVALAGDLKQAFLQVRIQLEDRDALRFHWIKDKETSNVEVLRFTRALFGLVQSPFLLGGTLHQHLESMKERYPSVVEEIKKSLYVDDVITGGETTEKVRKLKESAVAVFGEAQFELHKWHSNEPELEASGEPEDGKQSYAKEQLGVKLGETKMLGLPWNKTEDTIAVTFREASPEVSKREMLRFLASVYDPLGLASPVSLVGKLLYREVCDQHLSWDQKVPETVAKQWKKFERSLPDQVQVPRSLAGFKETIEAIDLHAFGDTSGAGTAAAVYAAVHQASGVTQGLLAAKSRLAKKGLTIPRLELVSAHMAANLAENVKNALQGQPVRSVHGWLDSTVALHWIRGEGSAYKQFVANRVNKIRDKEYIQWRHVGTDQNPADVGSRGCQADRLSELWFKGPEWLTEPDHWPGDILTQPSKETEAEAKLTKEIFATATETKDGLDEVLERNSSWKTVRVTTWMRRFLNNCKQKKSNRLVGPLTTSETDKELRWWVQRAQESSSGTERFEEDKLTLNLQKNSDGLYECRGRIQGNYPIYLPPSAVLSETLVQDAHMLTLHGGVGLTMAFIRRDYWIPRLRQLTKKVINGCFGCKKFQAKAFGSPPPGNLPIDRTMGSAPFQVLGVDYAGPILYKINKKRDGKAYILLFACSLTRAIHLELLSSQTTEEFIKAFKRFIARRGRPQKVYSDNGKSFVAASKWLGGIMKDEKIQDYLAHQHITWQFNLSRAPWWGGQFERMVGLVKRAMYKSIGGANLAWSELEEVMLDVEITLNNRPLTYLEDDVQLPTLTPHAMMFGQPNQLPEEDPDAIESKDLRKRARYLRRCKDVMWTRWTEEYIRSLRERHNLNHQKGSPLINTGDVVLIQGDERNRGKWNLGIVAKLIKGRDGVIRAARLRAGKSFLERAIQQLCPMELSCDSYQESQVSVLDPTVREFQPRRAAAAAAALRIKDIAQQDEL